MADLKGKDFIALRRLSTKDDQTLAVVGETCENVPVASLAPLLASGKIAPAPEAGGDFVVTRPSVFLTGGGGPERITFSGAQADTVPESEAE